MKDYSESGQYRTAATVTLIFLVGAIWASALSAGHDHGGQSLAMSGESVGHVDFGVSCTSDAAEAFDHSLTLMHHMMYEQARDAFAGVLEEDPDCAMAHWGVATTLFQPLWGTRPTEEVLARGREAVSKARELGPGDEREAKLLAATAAFFDPEDGAAYSERIGGWIEGMAAAREAAPDDDEVAALYALSRLTIAQNADDPNPLHDEAEAILRAIHADNPEHPGAVHYLIHSDDIDGRAENNPDIVAQYSDIAPQVPHALHMPSHIYVRLGKWPEVIEWNTQSAAAALDQPAGDYVSLHYIHAQDYKVYAYLQKGMDEQARAVIAESFQQGELQPGAGSAFHAATIPARYAVERRDWEAAAELAVKEPEKLAWDAPLGMWAEAQTWLARGLGAVHGDDRKAARNALHNIRDLRKKAEDQGESTFASYIGIEEGILAGWLAWLDGRNEDAVAAIQGAVELEERVEKHPITPGALVPPREALGDLLRALDRPEEALAAYAESDAVWPGRYNTLYGAARAAEAAGKEGEARDYFSALLDIAGRSERREVATARQYLEE